MKRIIKCSSRVCILFAILICLEGLPDYAHSFGQAGQFAWAGDASDSLRPLAIGESSRGAGYDTRVAEEQAHLFYESIFDEESGSTGHEIALRDQGKTLLDEKRALASIHAARERFLAILPALRAGTYLSPRVSLIRTRMFTLTNFMRRLERDIRLKELQRDAQWYYSTNAQSFLSPSGTVIDEYWADAPPEWKMTALLHLERMSERQRALLVEEKVQIWVNLQRARGLFESIRSEMKRDDNDRPAVDHWLFMAREQSTLLHAEILNEEAGSTLFSDALTRYADVSVEQAKRNAREIEARMRQAQRRASRMNEAASWEAAGDALDEAHALCAQAAAAYMRASLPDRSRAMKRRLAWLEARIRDTNDIIERGYTEALTRAEPLMREQVLTEAQRQIMQAGELLAQGMKLLEQRCFFDALHYLALSAGMHYRAAAAYESAGDLDTARELRERLLGIVREELAHAHTGVASIVRKGYMAFLSQGFSRMEREATLAFNGRVDPWPAGVEMELELNRQHLKNIRVVRALYSRARYEHDAPPAVVARAVARMQELDERIRTLREIIQRQEQIAGDARIEENPSMLYASSRRQIDEMLEAAAFLLRN
ncbi:MAG: hypothetical protein WCG78_03960 [Candidatus Omnitrophota bacterium]